MISTMIWNKLQEHCMHSIRHSDGVGAFGRYPLYHGYLEGFHDREASRKDDFV